MNPLTVSSVIPEFIPALFNWCTMQTLSFCSKHQPPCGLEKLVLEVTDSKNRSCGQLQCCINCMDPRAYNVFTPKKNI